MSQLLWYNFLSKSIKSIVARLRGRPSVPRERRRLSDLLMSNYNRTVQYGPLKGYKIPEQSHWGALARPSMLLGLYEREVVNALLKYAEKRDVFVDVGAADGFFAVGLVACGIFKRSYAFEINTNGRQVIKKSSEINGVAHSVSVRGRFDTDFVANAEEFDLSRSVVLIDIEGEEFDLLDSLLIEQLRRAVLVVELHDFHFADGAALRSALCARLDAHFEVTTITTGAREVPRSEFLDAMSDNERWLLCSEGRARRMEWLIALPRH